MKRREEAEWKLENGEVCAFTLAQHNIFVRAQRGEAKCVKTDSV